MMWIFHECVGFAFISSICVQFGFAFQGRFTELPSNITAKEGQNIEMACAFQSGTSSVYLEIQWWFIKAPEDQNSSEKDADEQMEFLPASDPDDEGTKISTVKVQGNDISHRLHISKVSKSDEGLYECRVTDANYGELLEFKVQAYLQVNVSARAPSQATKKTSPLHLTDKKPRRSHSGAGHDSRTNGLPSTSSSQATASKTLKHSPGAGTRTASGLGHVGLLVLCGWVKGTMV